MRIEFFENLILEYDVGNNKKISISKLSLRYVFFAVDPTNSICAGNFLILI